MNRQQVLQQAAAVARTLEANRLLSEGRYEDACRNDWLPWDGENGVQLDDADLQIPVLDSITQMPLAKDDVVVLSDGHAYSKNSMQCLLAHGVVSLETGRANLPLSGAPLVDLDYALLGLDPPTLESTAVARSRTFEVAMQAYRVRTTEQQREFERLRRRGLTTSEAVAVQESQRRESGFDDGIGNNAGPLPAPEDQLAVAFEEDPSGDVAGALIRSVDLDNAVFDYDIATNDNLLRRLSLRLLQSVDRDERRMCYTMIGRLFDQLPLWGWRFSISVLADLFPGDDVERAWMLEYTPLLHINCLAHFSLHCDLSKYAAALGQAQVVKRRHLLESNVDDDEFGNIDAMSDLIKLIYERGVTEQICAIPNLIHAFKEQFKQDPIYSQRIRMAPLASQSRLYELQSRMYKLQSRLGEVCLRCAVDDYAWPAAERVLADAIDQAATDGEDPFTVIRDVAESGSMFQHDIHKNGDLLARLSMLSFATTGAPCAFDVLCCVPKDRELFFVSVLVDLEGTDENETNYCVAPANRWLGNYPRVFRLDEDVERLEKYAKALGCMASYVADAECYDEIDVLPLIDLVQAIYSRGQVEPEERARRVAQAYLSAVEAADARNETHFANKAREEIDQARIALQR